MTLLPRLNWHLDGPTAHQAWADLLCWMGFSMAEHLVLEHLNKLVAKGYVDTPLRA